MDVRDGILDGMFPESGFREQMSGGGANVLLPASA